MVGETDLEKCAYGSEDEPDEEEDDETNPKFKGDPDLIRKDVMNRIQIR